MLATPELLKTVPVVSTVVDADGALSELNFDRNSRVLAAYQAAVEQWLVAATVTSHIGAVESTVDMALRLFHAENVTGELCDAEAEHYADDLQRFHVGDDDTNRFVQRLLTVDGEMPSVCVKYPALLLACLALVRANVPRQGAGTAAALFPRDSIWVLRVLFRHQLCLQRQSHSLFLEIATCIEALEAKDLSNAEGLDPATLVEMGHVQNYFHRRDLAAQKFRMAMQKSKLHVEEAAIMGVRTRWQQHLVVQAVLQAASDRPATPLAPDADGQPLVVGSAKAGHDLFDRPRVQPAGTDGTVAADDEATEALAVPPLTAVDKAIVLALCSNIRNENPHHGLTSSHMMTYVERLMVDTAPTPFLVKAQILLTRARLEHGRARVAERAFLQLNELVDQHTARRNPTLPTLFRTDPKYFYLVAFPTIWTLKSELGNVCMDESLHKTALDLYEQVQDWEKIIACCKLLDKRKKAENLARDLLEKDPHNPVLWVALGEATREDAYLWKAWELSQHKMAAPMRALAKLALEREHYDKVVEYFEAAVRVNPVFGGDWFTLGFASLRLKNLERSGEAFTRVCQMDPNDAFAWNNLASIMLQQGKLRPAFNAMSQALRNNRRSWRMWQNYFSIGVELMEVTEATHALRVALDVGDRQIRMEPASMRKFVDIAIRYIKGEIEGTDNVPATAGDEAATEGEALPHTSTVPDGEGDDAFAELTDLMPLAHDVEMPASFFPEKDAKHAAAAAERRVGIVERYTVRLRDLFAKLLDLFVTDAELYHAAAELFRYLDGPLGAFGYREKELRCAEQTDQWNRTETLLQRVLECLQRMSVDVTDALAAAGAGTVDAGAPAVLAAKSLLKHIDGAIESSGEYMDHTETYRQLMVLQKRVRQATKAATTA